jgi:outer membrane protein assembly factor BamB
MVILCAVPGALCEAAESPLSAPSPEVLFRNSLNYSGVYRDSGAGNYSGVLWHRQTGGAVRSSPVIAGGIVVIGSSDTNLCAFDASTGQNKWRFTADRAVTSTAAIANGRVFFRDQPRRSVRWKL